MFPSEIWEILQSTYFKEHLRPAAFVILEDFLFKLHLATGKTFESSLVTKLPLTTGSSMIRQGDYHRMIDTTSLSIAQSWSKASQLNYEDKKELNGAHKTFYGKKTVNTNVEEKIFGFA